MKNIKQTLTKISLVSIMAILSACGGAGEQLDFIQKFAEIRTDPFPEQAFVKFKKEILEDKDKEYNLWFECGDTYPEENKMELILIQKNGDKITYSGRGTEFENTSIRVKIPYDKAFLEKNKIILNGSGSGFFIKLINKLNFTEYSVEYNKEFVAKAFETKNSRIINSAGSISSTLGSDIAYVLTGNSDYMELNGIFSKEEEISRNLNDEDYQAEYKFLISELKNGTLSDLYELFKKDQIAIIKQLDAEKQEAKNANQQINIKGKISDLTFSGVVYNKYLNVNQADCIITLADGFEIKSVAITNQKYVDLVTQNKVTKIKSIDELSAIIDKGYSENLEVNRARIKKDSTENSFGVDFDH